MNKNSNKYDIAIIGSGLGGLFCGHILSSEGYRVLILERDVQPGGCLQSYRRNGLEFDTGFHYIGGMDKGEALYQPFRMLGLMDLPWVRLDNDCFDRVSIAGESYDFAQGYEQFAQKLASYFPEEREGLQTLVKLFEHNSIHQLDVLNPSISMASLMQSPQCAIDLSDTKVGHRGQDYEQWKLRKADECISLAETVIPGLRPAIETQYTTSPLTYRDYTHTPNGSAFGLRKDCGNPLLTFLSPRCRIPNMLLTGQSLMVHGIEGVTMTAL